MSRQKHQTVIADSEYNDQHSVIEELMNENALLRKDRDRWRKCARSEQHKSEELLNVISDMQKKLISLSKMVVPTFWNAQDSSKFAIDLSRSIAQAADKYADILTHANARNAELMEKVERLSKKVDRLEKLDEYHDGGSTPSSHKTITQKQIANEQKQRVKPAKKGPPVGHQGTSRAWDPKDVRTSKLKKCTCGCMMWLVLVKTYKKMLVELEFGQVVERLYVVHVYDCMSCKRRISDKPDEMLDGTSISKTMLKKIVRLHKSNKSMSELCETMEIMWDYKMARATIANGIDVAASLMRKEERAIMEEIRKGKNGNIDETVEGIEDHPNARIWVVMVDNKHVLYYPSLTRERSVLWEMGISPDLQVTTDAYVVYNVFGTQQLCWAHVKTKVKNGVTKNNTSITRYLYGNLMDIYKHAKTLPPDTPPEIINNLIQAVKKIGQHLLDRGVKAGAYVINCADRLFTAVTHPGMSLTNNYAETLIRPVVIRRKVSYRFATMKGAKNYCTIASCLATWKLQDKDPDEELTRLFSE